MCGLEQSSEAYLITFVHFIAGSILLWFIAFTYEKVKPKTIGKHFTDREWRILHNL